MFVWLFSGDATKTTKHSSNIVDTSVLHSKSARQPGMSVCVCVPVCVCVLQSCACRWSVWECVVRPAAGDPPHHLLAAGLGWDGDQPQLVPRPVSHSQGVWLCSLFFEVMAIVNSGFGTENVKNNPWKNKTIMVDYSWLWFPFCLYTCVFAWCKSVLYNLTY